MAAPAKLNLWLRVGPRREDGFHDLDTLFCTLDLADDLILRPGEPRRGHRIGVRHVAPLSSPPDLGPPQRNLALRAAREFQAVAGEPENLRITLLKRIPPGGGLGGGSSDAAAVLRGLRRMHPDLVAAEQLRDMAEGLGSDIPFFLTGHPLAVGRGRGDELMPLTPLPPRPVVLVLPPFPVSTADAYRWLDQAREGAEDGATTPSFDLADTEGGTPRPPDVGAPTVTWTDVEARARNDFEAPVFEQHPVLGEIRERLLGAGAGMALLAGSGSSVFGVFDRREQAESAAEAVEAGHEGVRALVTATRSR